MKINEIARSVLVFIIIFVLGVLLHTSVFAYLPLGVVTPNILLLITAAFGFMNSSSSGMLMGFLCGLMMDCYYPEYFGLNCLIYLFIGFLNGLFSRYFFGDDIRMPMLLIGSSDLLYGFVMYLLMFLVRKRFDVGFYAFNIIIPEAVYTLVVFMILYYPMLLAMKWSGRFGGRGKNAV